jgi:hypothetical protein
VHAKQVVVYIVYDGRRDMESFLARRLLGAYDPQLPLVSRWYRGANKRNILSASDRHFGEACVSNGKGAVKEALAREMVSRILLLVCLLAFPWPVPAAAAGTCTVVDLMPDFWRALAANDSAAEMRTAVIDPHPDLYNDNYVLLPTAAKWEAKLTRERAYDEAHRQEITAAEQYLAANVPGYMQEFRKAFPDYRCDFTFYIAPSFGNMDGAAGAVNGQHRIIFAPDVIPRYHKLNELKLLINHETFHIYHHQVTGVFGATEEAVPTIEVALWSEGLATFVSWRMNPGFSLDTALLQPGIPEGTRPHLSAIAAELRGHLDEKDQLTYARYFQAGEQPAGYPPRAGYYVGFLIAQDLSKRYSLRQLAQLKGRVLHEAIMAELQQIAGSAGSAPGQASMDRARPSLAGGERRVHDVAN